MKTMHTTCLADHAEAVKMIKEMDTPARAICTLDDAAKTVHTAYNAACGLRLDTPLSELDNIDDADVPGIRRPA